MNTCGEGPVVRVGIKRNIIRHFLAIERNQWFPWFPVAMGIGIGVYFAMPQVPVARWVPALFAVATLILAVASILNVSLSQDKDNSIITSFAALMLGAFALGWASSEWRVFHSQAPVLEKKTSAVTVIGHVAAIENMADGARRILLRDPSIGKMLAEDSPEYVRITVRGHDDGRDDLTMGDRVQMRAILFPPMRPLFPGGYDFSRTSWFKKLGGIGYALSRPEIIDASTEEGWAVRLAAIRYRISTDIRRILPGDQGAISAALLVGDRRGISDTTMQMIRSSGLAHLLAISGLHMGIVSGLFFIFFRAGLALCPRLVLYYPTKKWAAGLALIAAFAYLLLVGQTVPTQRAFLMTSLVLLAVILDRRAISMRLVATAAVVILLIAPEALVGPSFQMSFAAVTALVAFYEGIRGSWHALIHERQEGSWPYRLGQRMIWYIGAVLLTTLVASSATFPFAVYHFQQYSAYGLLSNVIAIPLMAFWIMPWGVLSLLMLPFIDPILPLAAMAGGIDIMIRLADFVSHLPGSVVVWTKMHIITFVLVTLGGLWMALWQGRWRWWGIVALVIAALLHRQAPLPKVLIAGEGNVAAILIDDEKGREPRLLVSSRRARRVIRDWSRALGGVSVTSWKDAGDDAPDCDPVGCIFHHGDTTIAFAYQVEALRDCPFVDIMVAFFPVRDRCQGPEIILDRFDLWRDGAHALYWDQGSKDVQTVRGEQGFHPWTRHGTRHRTRHKTRNRTRP